MTRTRVCLLAAALLAVPAVLPSPATCALGQVTIEPVFFTNSSVRSLAPGPNSGYRFTGDNRATLPVMSEDGTVVFRAKINKGSTNAVGIYVHRPDEPLAAVVDTTFVGSPGFAVPGLSEDARFLDFKAPQLNNNGDVLFHANVSEPGLPTLYGLYAVNLDEGVIRKVVDTTEIAPGTSGGNFRTFLFDNSSPTAYATLNDAGQVAFWASYDSSNPDVGLFGSTVAGGSVVALATRETIPNGLPITTPAPFSNVRPVFGMNSAGQLAFAGSVPISSGSYRDGLFVVPVDGSSVAETVSFEGASVPFAGSSIFNDFAISDITDGGDIVFQGTGSDGYTGLYSIAAAGGAITRIVDTRNGGLEVPGDPAPAAFNALSVGPVNEAGRVGFFARIRNSGAGSNQGIYLGEIGEEDVLRVQDAQLTAPGMSAPAVLDDYDSSSAAVNALGNMVFSAEGISDSGVRFRGIYFYDHCARTVYRIVDSTISGSALGDTFSTSGTQEKKLVAYQDELAISGRYNAITDNNQVAFLAQFNNTEMGVFVATLDSSGGGGNLEITCPADILTECPVDTDPSSLGEAVAIDLCTDSSVPTTYVDVTSNSCGDAGTITRVWTADDGAGNTTTCEQVIQLDDSTAPVLVDVPVDTTAECGEVPDAALVTAEDACDANPVVEFVETSSNGLCPADYTLVRTWTATDACGNTVSASQTIAVADTVAPTLTCPADISLAGCDADTSPAVAGEAEATDACSDFTLDYADATTNGCGGTTVIARTWTALDACGNASSCVQNIVTTDETAPVVTCPADALDLPCDADTSVAALGSATATDDCGAVSVSSSDSVEVTCSDAVTITRSWAAIDDCGNVGTCVQTISTVDDVPPMLTCPADVLDLDCGADLAPEATGFATATDECGEVVVEYADDVTPTCGDAVSVVRTWTATDACGNFVTCEQLLETTDTTPPVLEVDTTPITANGCEGGIDVALPVATATDECGEAYVSNDAPATFPEGTTTVTYTAEDDCGNVSTATVDVTVSGGSTIVVDAKRYVVGLGHHPQIWQEPIAGVEVCAYDRSYNSCARDECGLFFLLRFPCIVSHCAPVACAITDENGFAELNVPPGKYVVISEDVTGMILPTPLGVVVDDLACGESDLARLRQIEIQTGRRFACKLTRLTGSELLIIEPEEVLWDGTEQLYPFVFESVGDWDVTVGVAPPDGFVSDYDELSDNIENSERAVQFTITEVGSDLVPTETTFHIVHNGKKRRVRSEVGISLTAEYAKSRGFNISTLRRQGLIKEKPMREMYISPKMQIQRMQDLQNAQKWGTAQGVSEIDDRQSE